MYIRKRFKILNECEIAELLGEERHYPSFLDKFRTDVIEEFIRNLEQMTEEHVTAKTFNVTVDNEYCHTIVFNVKLNVGEDVFDRDNYKLSYYNNSGLKDGKLENPVINTIFPVDDEWYTLFDLCRAYLMHELTHLYDDWMRIKNGKGNLCFDDKVNVANSIKDIGETFNSEFAKAFCNMLYMTTKSEEQAFMSELLSELFAIGCTEVNYREKMKETVPYMNIRNAKKNLVKAVNECDYGEIFMVMSIVKRKNLRIGFDFDLKNETALREKLIRWAELAEDRFLKRYYSVVGYYLECGKKTVLIKEV